MGGVSKKMFISILTSVIVMVTMVATTFAWVGIFTYANTNDFQLNLKTTGLDSNYYLIISSTGVEGTFSDEIPSIELKRQIIDEKYGNRYSDLNDDAIEQIYNNLKLETSTTIVKDDNTLDSFKSIDYSNYYNVSYKESTGYYKFDLYLSVDTKEGVTSETTGIDANVYLDEIENMLIGTIHSGVMSNENPFLGLPSSPINDILKTVPKAYNIDSKNAVRVALSLYDPILINKQYEDELPAKTIIYHGGNKFPSYDDVNDVYDMGGCMSVEQNLALQELFILRPSYNIESTKSYLNEKFNLIKERESKELDISNENRLIWNRNENTANNYFGIMNGMRTKIKITVHLWFEGWDADCLKSIELQPVCLNLTFTTTENEI